VGDLVLGGLQREPVEYGLWAILGCVPHARQDQLGEAGQAHGTALRLGEQGEQLEEGRAQLCVLGHRGEEHPDDLGSQALVPATKRVD